MWWFLFQEAALAPDDSVSTSTKSALIIFISGERKHHQSSSDTTIHRGNGKIKSRAAILIQKTKQYERVSGRAHQRSHTCSETGFGRF